MHVCILQKLRCCSDDRVIGDHVDTTKIFMMNGGEEFAVTMEGGRPWGFTLQGGADFRSPLKIGKVRSRVKREFAQRLRNQLSLSCMCVCVSCSIAVCCY